MAPLKRALRKTFSSLKVRNYRLYFFGQIVSLSGTWMQSVAQMWLVYQLTDSGVALGVVTALQFTPVLLAGMWGGIVADRFDKRKILIACQAVMASLALILGTLTALEVVELWMIYALAFCLGSVMVIEVPTRQSFVIEMVGEDRLPNAVGLNSTVFTSARVVGPAIGGLMIAAVGIAWCFLINAVSFVGVITALKLMRPDELHRGLPAKRAKGQVREGLRYVWTHPVLRTSMIVMAIIGTMSFNFRIYLPVMAEREFGGGAGLYGTLSAVQGIGTVFGALYAASRGRPTRRRLILASLAYGVLIVAVGLSTNIIVALLALIPMGAAGIAFIATANSTLQLNSSEVMRGRVMALYSVVFLGSTPIGSPIAGWIAENWGVRTGFFVSALACFVAGGYALSIVRRERLATRAVEPEPVVPATPDDAVLSGSGTSSRRLLGAVRFALRR
ncbi:MAG: MFS transporter [Actinomycetota bacterium]